MKRVLQAAVTIVVGLFLISSCASSPQGGTSSGGPATPAPTPAAPPGMSPTPAPDPATATPPPNAASPTPAPLTDTIGRCLASQLSLSAGAGNAGAGTVGRPFVFTNTAETGCALFGYPGMQMLSGGRPIPTKVVWTPGTEQTVTLAPGGTASFLAWWHDQTGYTTPCPTAEQVEVTPPNAYAALTVAVPIQACPDGTIDVDAVTAGSTGGQPT
jgi:Protein of unknown function (DUF4232)